MLVSPGNALAQDQTVPATAPTSPPADASTPAAPADAPPADHSEDVSRAQVPDATQSPANPQPTNIPLFPAQLGNPVSPYSSSSVSPQSPQITSPNLYVTGSRDLSQVSTNNALTQAFSQGGIGSGFYGDTGMNYEHPPIERIRLGPFDLESALVVTAVADDDLRTGGQSQTGNQVGKRSDVSFNATPALLLEYGMQDGQKGFASLIYAPTLTRYYHESAQNTDDQNVAFNATYPFQRLTLDFTEAYTQTTGVNTDSNERTTQNSSSSGIGASYKVDERVSLSTDVQYVDSTFSGASGQGTGSGSGGTTASVNNSLSYRLSEKLTLGPSVNVGVDRPQVSAKSTYEQGIIALNYAPTEKIGLFAQGGAQLNQYDQGGGNTVNPVFSVGVGYNPFDSTSFQLNASQGVHTSTAAEGQTTSGQTVVSTGISASVNQRILQRIFLTFAFSYDHDDNQALSGSGNGGSTAGSTEDTFTYRPSISYAPTAWTSISVYYQYLSNDSDSLGQSYYDNQVGVSVSAKF
jgi:hypothetical protein